MANRRFIDFPIAASVGNNDIVLIWQDGLNKQTTKATLLQGSPSSLAGLTDVDIAGLINGQILQYNSTTSKWENVDRTDINLSELGDVTIVAPANGQVLVYNSSTSKWENSSGGYVPYTGAVTTVNLGAQSILAGSFVKAGGTAAQFLKANGSVDSTAYGTGSVTSVALTMPTAFSVAGSPITTAGTLAVTGAGTVGQYIRGDGSLADFPATTGGGSSVSYYLNGSVSQGTIGGVAYKELNRAPVFGAGTDITINADGYIASFITDALDPNKLLIPAGNWNFETYFSANSSGGSPSFYIELYKYNGTTFTLIASSSSAPELIAFGTNLNPYFSTLAVPETVLALTDRLALRYYVTHSGRTITLHTENGHLCEVITTFTTGLTALNGLTNQVQFFAVGTSGTDFAISSATDTHTFNLPTASASNRGALSSADWTTFNGKQNALTNPVTGTGTSGQVAYFNGTSAITGESGLVWDAANNNLSIGGATANSNLTVSGSDNTDIFTVLAGANSRLHVGTVTTGTNVYVRSQNNYTLNLGVNTSNYLSIFNSGNIFIGTSASDNGARFQVSGYGAFTVTGDNTRALSVIGTTNRRGYLGHAFGTLFIQNNNYFNGSAYVFDDISVGCANVTLGSSIAFQTGAANTDPTTKVFITNGGNVGIGTASPIFGSFSRLTVGNSSSDGGITIQSSSTGISRLFFAKDDTSGVEGVIRYLHTNNSMQFWTAADIRMTINSGGNVGIGTASPTAISGFTTLSVNNSTFGGIIETMYNNTPYGRLFTNANFYVGLLSVQNVPLIFGTNDTERMRITSGGNVLIGTTTDNGAKFRVFGTGVSANIYSDNNTYCLGLGYQGTLHGYVGGISSALYALSNNGGQVVLNASSVWVPVSDIKRKRNFENYNLGLDAILGLKPKYYHMDFQKDSEQKQVGLVAQEVKKFIPQAFEQNDDFIGLNYNAIIVTMVKAIQELKEEIQTLKN
jgi:hypothetical protein